MMSNIKALEARKAQMQDKISNMTREVDTQTLNQSDMEIRERELKENILRLKEHSEVVKKQN